MNEKTILVIEDNELNRKLIKALLQRGSFRVLEVGDAEKGLDLARAEKPDLILMDIQLPGMDGLKATRILKNDPVLKNIPIVALTAYAMDGDVEKAQSAGCDGYITKPVDFRSFFDMVFKFLQEDPSPSAPNRESRSDPKKILIVDDDPLTVKLLQAHLLQHKYEVFCAYGGSEALEKVSHVAPDLILLDAKMPGMDGYEVTRKLKKDSPHRNIPIILITAPDAMQAKVKGLEAGADEFINKPIHKSELLARIRSLILCQKHRDRSLTRPGIETPFKNPCPDGVLPGQHLVRRKVLIAEDDPKDAHLLKYFLEQMPLRVEMAGSGEESLRRLEERDIDLVLLDVQFPGIDALEICRRLKGEERTRNIQVLLICRGSDLESKIGGFETEADDLLMKPIDEYELKVRTDTLLKKKIYLDDPQNICGTSGSRAPLGKPDPMTGAGVEIPSL